MGPPPSPRCDPPSALLTARLIHRLFYTRAGALESTDEPPQRTRRKHGPKLPWMLDVDEGREDESSLPPPAPSLPALSSDKGQRADKPPAPPAAAPRAVELLQVAA